MGLFLFFFLALVSVGSVLAMIVTRNQAYSALFLVLAFAALGGLFGLLDAPFIAVVQIIIYAGAIMVLFIFVIMMINLREGDPRPERKSGRRPVPRSWLSSSSSSSSWPSGAILPWLWPKSPAVELTPAVTSDGSSSPKYLYPFEITSILIIAALVGRDRPGEEEGTRMIPTSYFFVLSLVLFVLGIVAFFVKRDLITMFMAVEVMLNAANLAFLALAKVAGLAGRPGHRLLHHHRRRRRGGRRSGHHPPRLPAEKIDQDRRHEPDERLT